MGSMAETFMIEEAGGFPCPLQIYTLKKSFVLDGGSPCLHSAGCSSEMVIQRKN